MREPHTQPNNPVLRRIARGPRARARTAALISHLTHARAAQGLLITTGMFGAMTGLAMFAKPGAALRYGVPLGGGLLMLMAVGIGGMFVPVTSAWYPILHNVYLYGGLTLFTLYIAYDTQKMIDEYEMGEDDHIKHATDLFIDFKIVFSRVLQLLMMSRD